MTEYNKLVRDLIPTILTVDGKNFSSYIASDEEYERKLKEKLLEEVNEFIENPCLEELADIQQVLDTILYNMGHDNGVLNKKMFEKAVLRGTFSKKIILEKVEG